MRRQQARVDGSLCVLNQPEVPLLPLLSSTCSRWSITTSPGPIERCLPAREQDVSGQASAWQRRRRAANRFGESKRISLSRHGGSGVKSLHSTAQESRAASAAPACDGYGLHPTCLRGWTWLFCRRQANVAAIQAGGNISLLRRTQRLPLQPWT